MVAAAALKRVLEAGGDGTHSALLYLAAVKHGDVKKLYLDFHKSSADKQENVLAVLEYVPRSCKSLEDSLAPSLSDSTVYTSSLLIAGALPLVAENSRHIQQRVVLP